MQLDSLKTFDEIKLTRANIRHKLRFAAGDIKMESRGLVSDTKDIAKINIMQFGAGYLSKIVQKQIYRLFRKKR